MISEKQLVSNYSFFWKSILPLQKIFQRKVNLEKCKTGDKFLESTIIGRRRSYISHVSFWVYFYSLKYKTNIISEKFDKRTEDKIESLCSKQFDEYNRGIENINAKLSMKEWNEIYKLAQRLYKFFDDLYENKNIEFNPRFKGCGFLDDCYGDILVGDCLYEIKMIDRNFRVNDFQQILTYCSLNSISKQYNINKVCILNPRSGEYFKADLDNLCIMISGKNKSKLFHEIIDFLTGGGISK